MILAIILFSMTLLLTMSIADSFSLFALTKWVENQSKEKKYPWIPYVSPLDRPTSDPWRIGTKGVAGDGTLEFNQLPAPDVEP